MGLLSAWVHYSGFGFKPAGQEGSDLCGCSGHTWQCWWPACPLSPLVSRLIGASALYDVSLEALVTLPWELDRWHSTVTSQLGCCYGDGDGGLLPSAWFSAWQL